MEVGVFKEGINNMSKEKYEICPICLERETALEATYIYNITNNTSLACFNEIERINKEISKLKDEIVYRLEISIKEEVDDNVRKKIMNLKRDIYNERDKLFNKVYQCPETLLKDVSKFTNLLRKKHSLIKQIYIFDNDHYEIERIYIHKIYNDNDSIAKTLPLIQPLILEKFNQYLKVPLLEQNSKIRKIDNTLTKVLSRAALKTSPFSTLTYTKIKAMEVNEYIAPKKTSIIKLNESYVFRIFDQCIKLDCIKEDINFSIIETLSIGEDKLFWTILTDNPEERGKVYKTLDKLITIKKNDLLISIINNFKTKNFKLNELRSFVFQKIQSFDKTEVIINQLLEMELLVANYCLRQNTDDILEELLSKLDQYKHNEIIQNIILNVEIIKNKIRDFDNLQYDQQIECMEFIYDKFKQLCIILNLPKMDKSKLMYQDAIYDKIEYFDVSKLDEHVPGLINIMKLFNIYNEPYIIQKLMARDFKRVFGNKTVKMDTNWVEAIRVLLDSYLSNMNIWERQYKIDNTDYEDENINNLCKVKNRFINYLNDCLSSKKNTIIFDEKFIKELIDEIPNDIKSKRQSNSFFIQYSEDNMILNHFYEGNLCYFGRFLKYFSEDLQKNTKFIDYIKNNIRNYNYYDIKSTYGFNANSRFEICEEYIDLMNTPQKSNRIENNVVNYKDLEIRYNNETQLLDLILNEKKIHIYFFGSLIPMLLPGVVSNLSMLSRQTTMYTDFNRMILSFYNEIDRVKLVPRIVYDKIVLSKRKWILNLYELTLKDDVYELLTIFKCNGLPVNFFVYDFDPELKADIVAKPQYIDITSVILRKLFFQFIDGKKYIVIEEQNPITKGHDKTKEFLYEITKGEEYEK